MNDIRLKPCPFCGGNAEFTPVTHGLAVKCSNCGATAGFVKSRTFRSWSRKPQDTLNYVFRSLYEDVAKKWNGRVSDG